MTRDLRDLAVVATRGTSRADLPAPAGTLALALSSVPGETPEALLLGRAALLGLHARAGAPLQDAAGPPPTPLPAPERPVPPALSALLPALVRTDPVLTTQALGALTARGWTLNAAQMLALYGQDADLARPLWALADVRARAILTSQAPAHSLYREAQKAEEEARWAAQLAALAELRGRDPAQGARALQDLWAGQPADQRKELLDLVRRDLRAEDRPLLEAATRDRSPEVQKSVRQLLGHLSGPLQDELLALLPQAVKVSGLLKKKISFGAFDLPAALGKPRAGQDDDSDLHRLLGALPTPLILNTLKIGWDVLHKALRNQHWSLAYELQEPQAPVPTPPTPEAARARLRDLMGQPKVASEQLLDAVQALESSLELSLEPADVQTALATRTLELFQWEGQSWQAEELALVLRRSLSPDLTVPAPTPLPFGLPPRPKKLPSWQTPADWEEEQRRDHAYREDRALHTWRDLTHTLQLRREWRGALSTQPSEERTIQPRSTS
ncbi:hypothetical protein E7T06_12525 [Deinococcus sp. Arct2-2]|uniref:DUF5691 domain-containing protein n=1 Tax=Deinococcus sp. Arct2-2 TaxID=2568653 RepID=UPI0010A54509|nr:DUF5691 domain-containing protein [Deinococcus sp. Arct2-2]THF69310.1 hypothetical protein E7T06_12525 [Deinococcus sp. Arct2-2]